MDTRRAVIDVGTNSVKLLVADVQSGGTVIPLKEKSEQTRLGQGFYETHRLLPENIRVTAETVGQFAGKARQLGAEFIRVIATSAARDALNQEDLLIAIESESGLKVEVISGALEADYAFRGVISDPVFAGHRLLILDVGGGSTEFILGSASCQDFRESFPLGTVRLLEKLNHSDPPTASELQYYQREVGEVLTERVQPLLHHKLKKDDELPWLVGTGGTATILARIEKKLPEYDREAIEASSIPLTHIREHRQHLWSLPLAERRNVIGLPPKRADVILGGVLIYEAVMTLFGFEQLYVSTRGLRFAAVLPNT